MKNPISLGAFSLIASLTVHAQVLTDDFESGTSSPNWTAFNATLANNNGDGADSSDFYASLAAGQLIGFTLDNASDFTVSFDVRVQDTPNRQFNFHIGNSTGTLGTAANNANYAAINLRHQSGGWAAFDGAWQPIALSALAPGVWTRVTIIASDWGTPSASFALSSGGITVSDLRFYQNGDPTTTKAIGGNFNSVFGSNPGFEVDNVLVVDNSPPSDSAIVITDFSINPLTGAGSVTFTSSEGTGYTLEASDDLGNLMPFASVGTTTGAVGTETTFTFSDPNAVGKAKRFYRVVVP